MRNDGKDKDDAMMKMDLNDLLLISFNFLIYEVKRQSFLLITKWYSSQWLKCM